MTDLITYRVQIVGRGTVVVQAEDKDAAAVKAVQQMIDNAIAHNLRFGDSLRANGLGWMLQATDADAYPVASVRKAPVKKV